MPATPTFRTTTRHMLKESKTYASQTLMGGLSGFESPIGLDRRDRLSALKSGDIGFVHSWDINTSVDGPGTRMTVFMSGCPLRCQYCQNPDTWKMRDGKPVYLDAMIKKVDRYKDLFKATHGGITFSGGESMMQPPSSRVCSTRPRRWAYIPASIHPASSTPTTLTRCSRTSTCVYSMSSPATRRLITR